MLYFYVSFIGTYNTAVKAAKTVLEGGVAQTEAETDYNQPRKRKKNKKYISSSEDEEMNNFSNISRGSEVPAPDSLLPNKLKVLLKSKSMKMSAKCEQKNTSVGKLFSRNKSRVKSLSPSKLINTTLDENPIRQHSLPNEGIYICTYILNIIS